MTGFLPRARQWSWLAALGAGVLLGGMYFAMPPGSTQQSRTYELIGLAAVVSALIAVAFHAPRGKVAWILIAAGQLAFVVGDVMWAIYAEQGVSPFPSFADAAYLAGYPLIAAGLAIAVRRRIAGGDRASLLDAAILTTGAATAWWVVVLGPQAAAADPEPLSVAISVAYPIGDLMLLGMALALAVTPGARGASFALLIGSLGVVLVADLVFTLQNLEGTYTDGSWVDALWIAGYVLFAASALHPSMARLVEPRPVAVTLLGPGRLLLLGAAMIMGPALLLLEHATTGGVIVVVAVATAMMSVLVLGRLSGMVRHLTSDIERREALEQQLAFQAFHDPLTGLANRRRFISAASRALEGPGPTAALFLDLDDFKHVNDELGHDAGDTLLLAVGERVLAAVRPGDVVGRLGGDEFAVLLEDAETLQRVEAVASRLVESLGAPIDLEGRSVAVSASVGVALRDPGEVMAVDELLRRADVAMYHAKARGKHRWATWTAGMDTPPSGVPSLVRKPISAA